MSVINTMLKDLEQRGISDGADDVVLRGLSSSAPGKYNNPKATNYYLISALSVIVVVLVMVIVYLVSPFQLVVASKDEHPVMSATQNNNPPLTAKETVVEMTPVNVTTAQMPKQQPMQQPMHEQVQAPIKARTEQVKPEPEIVAVDTRPAKKSVERLSERNNARKEVRVVESLPDMVAEEDFQAEQEISKTQREPTREEKSQEAYLSALSMYNRGRVQESKTLLKDALNYDAYNLDARKLLASMYLQDDKAGIAVVVIEKGLANYAANQDLLRLYLQAQVQLENYAKAIAIMEQRLRLATPEDIAYLAGLYQKNGGHLSAVKLYSQALQLKPVKSVWWMGQGISFEALSQQEEALKSYQQSIVSGQLSSQLAGYVKNRINTIEQIKLKSTS